MARRITSGAELNSTGTGVEFTALSGVGTVTTIATSPVRSGGYSLRFLANNTAVGQVRMNFAASDESDHFFARIYFRLTTAVSAASNIFILRNTANQDKVGIRLNTDNTLTFRNLEDAASIGSDTAALSTGRWYRIEIELDVNTPSSSPVSARLDGTQFASGTLNLATGIAAMVVGMSNIFATGEFHVDDMALNDDSGSSQNSWPGAGSIIGLHPNATGDSAQWEPNTGSDPNYQYVDENPTDETTTYLRSRTTNETDDYNIEASGLTSEIIKVVHVGFRATRSAGTTSSGAVIRLKASSGGTTTESAEELATNSSFRSNDLDSNLAFPYPITSYTKPGGSDAWTPADLDTAQIGMRCSTGSGDRYVHTTAIWLMFEYEAKFTAGVAPILAAFTLPSVTGVIRGTASTSPVLSAFSLQQVTATHRSIAATAPVLAAFTLLAVVATYIQVATAQTAPINSTFSVQSVTATHRSIASASPILAQFSLQSTAATHRSTATTAPVNAAFSILAVNASGGEAAVVAAIEADFALQAVSATHRSRAEATPLLAQFSIQSVNATHRSQAQTAPILAQFAVQLVSATHRSTGAVTPIVAQFVLQTLTATHRSAAAVLPVGVAFTLPSVTAINPSQIVVQNMLFSVGFDSPELGQKGTWYRKNNTAMSTPNNTGWYNKNETNWKE